MRSKKVDFFISYTKADLAWAEWIDSELRQAEYSTIAQFNDFKPGGNIINEMHKGLEYSRQVIGVLSPNYLSSEFAGAEWMAALRDDPLGEKRRLLLVRVGRCELSGLLPNVIYVDIVGLSEDDARIALLAGIKTNAPKSTTSVPFPELAETAPIYPPLLPNYWHLPLSRKPYFTGRDNVINDLEATFSNQKSHVIYALTGLGGAGKTRIAIEYCYVSLAKYDVIWWLDASSERLLIEGLSRLRNELLSETGDGPLTADAIKRDLAQPLKKLKSLFVFDNAATPEVVRRNLPNIPVGHILVTSRDPVWSDADKTFEVRPLARADAISFLTTRSSDNDNEAARLCEQLGDLPIAIEQAALYILRTRCGIRTYSAAFAKRREQAQKFTDEAESVIAATWLVSVKRLLYEDPIAVGFVRLFSLFAAHPIPLDYFPRTPTRFSLGSRALLGTLFGLTRFLFRLYEDTSNLTQRSISGPLSLTMPLESLRRYGLIDINEQSVSLHPLVRSVIQSETRPTLRRNFIRQCADLLSDARGDRSKVDEATKLWCLHVFEIAKIAERNSISNRVIVRILINATDLLATTSEKRLSETPENFHQAQRLAKLLPTGERDLWETIALLRLASAYRETDQYPQGAEYLRKAIQRILETARPDRSVIIRALADYGDFLLLDWETSFASLFYEAAIKLEKMEAEKSLPLANLLDDYAEILRNSGEYDAAESVAIEALSMATELLPPDHMLLVRHRYRLGTIQNTRGDTAAARRNLESAYTTGLATFGDESPYLKGIRSEIDALKHPEIRKMSAKAFENPRKIANEDDSIDPLSPIGELVPGMFAIAGEIAEDNLRKIVVPALTRHGLLVSKDSTEENPSLFQGISKPTRELAGRALRPTIVPLYEAIRSDKRWSNNEPQLPIFREEILNQYDFTFRRRMFINLSAKQLRKLPKRDAPFHEIIRFFEKNVRHFYSLIPGCLEDFERALHSGQLSGNRRGIHGLALQLDAPFYLRRLKEKANLRQ